MIVRLSREVFGTLFSVWGSRIDTQTAATYKSKPTPHLRIQVNNEIRIGRRVTTLFYNQWVQYSTQCVEYSEYYVSMNNDPSRPIAIELVNLYYYFLWKLRISAL